MQNSGSDVEDQGAAKMQVFHVASSPKPDLDGGTPATARMAE
jgi:hypothetical protein